jgi:hypothetical protein
MERYKVIKTSNGIYKIWDNAFEIEWYIIFTDKREAEDYVKNLNNKKEKKIRAKKN